MKKSEIVKAIAYRVDRPPAEINRILKLFVKTIQENLVKGEKVTIAGLGRFQVKPRKKIRVRNFKTGQWRLSNINRKLSFKPTAKFKILLSF
ncbi:MAG: HU family DNA-binding protein [Elusimicrobiota bacterium]|nr:HU family DNA-binding protein [Elusimicrobiota bacterium]